MSRLAEIMKNAKNYEPQFKTLDDLKEWHRQEALKTSIAVNKQNLLARSSRLYCGANVPEKHASCTFANYFLCENSSMQLNALNVCRTYANTFRDQFSVGRCMIFRGTTGTGKNHLATAIVNSVLADGFTALIIKISDLMGQFRKSYSGEGGLTEDKLIKKLIDIDLLVLDEIDMAHNSNDERVQLNRIIDNRVLAVKPTIVISNLEIDDLKIRLGARIIDRLLENDGPLVPFEWPSYRRRK